jgi:3-dehydroshikimate dehydratase
MVSGIAAAQTYVVDRYQDDSNKGSLRWAIEQANAKLRCIRQFYPTEYQ